MTLETQIVRGRDSESVTLRIETLKRLPFELEQLSKTEKGRQKQIHYNPTWHYFKELIKEELHSEEGSRFYAKRKSDVEPVFGVRRVHVTGRQAAQTEIRFLFMSMTLTKLRVGQKSVTRRIRFPSLSYF